MRNIVILLSIVVPAGNCFARGWEEIKKAGTLQIATEGAFRPFNYFEGSKLKGFEIELGDEMAKRVGLKDEWRALAFDSLLIGLDQDRYDFVAASHGITPEREKAVDFLAPHYCTGAVIVSRDSGPKTAAELKGKVLAVAVGTTYFEHLKKMSGIGEVKTYPKDSDALQSLLQGRVDAWIGDRFMALDAIKAHPEAKLRVGDLLFPERIGMAVAKGNKSLHDNLNKALKDILKDGTYKKLSLAYFGQDIRCK